RRADTLHRRRRMPLRPIPNATMSAAIGPSSTKPPVAIAKLSQSNEVGLASLIETRLEAPQMDGPPIAKASMQIVMLISWLCRRRYSFDGVAEGDIPPVPLT